MSGKPPARSARPPGKDWQDSYFSLDERYRLLQKKFNEQEQALKLVKVARRKEDAPPTGPSLSSVSARRPSLHGAPHAASNLALTSSYNVDTNIHRRSKAGPFFGSATNPIGAGAPHQPTYAVPNSPSPVRAAFDHVISAELASDNGREGSWNAAGHSSLPAQHPSPSLSSSSFAPDDSLARTQQYIPVPSAALPQAARAAAVSEASAWGDAAALPDPSMVWGTDGQSSMQNYVVASALYHANEELRRKLNESSTTLQTLQQDLASSRAQHTALQTRLENVSQQMHQLVRERDLASQKYTNASHTITDMERTLRDRVAEEEKIRFSMESQIAELRSRLVVGADSNELLQKDVRSLLTETRDRAGEVMQLRSKLALSESALSAQRNVNENMLVELKSLNVQLVEERKRLITVTREAQVASLSGTRIADLQEQLRRVQAERTTMEREHVALMSEFVHVTEDALRHARDEVRTDVADWKAAAQHWEQVSQLLYKDIAERTQQHLQCRAECETAKEQRDTTSQQLRALKEEAALLTAKLELVWPTHLADTRDLSLEDIHNVFDRRDRKGMFLFDERRRQRATALRQKRRADAAAVVAPGGETGTAAAPGQSSRDEAAEGPGHEGTAAAEDDVAMSADLWDDFPADPTTATAQLQELHEVNATLLSEMHQLRLTNDLLQDRLSSLTGQQKKERERVAAAEASLQRREKTGHQLLAKQLDRVAFLEEQVTSLRGYHVAANAPIDQVGDNENIFELFLGQLVAAAVPEGVDVPDLFSHVFCSVDFLVHETITTPTVRGLNGFFDVTASFCVSMDALLLYYLHTRQLLVQLHRVRSEGETAAAAAAAADETTTRARETLSVGEDRRGGRGSTGGSAGTRSSSSTHPSLRMAENMYETIAEGQVSLVEIVTSDACRESARPTMRGHVRLCTPEKRHIASLEFQLVARRPYSSEFLRLLQEAAATSNDADDAAASHDSDDFRLLDWMRTTANTSAQADGRPSESSHARVGVESKSWRRTATSPLQPYGAALSPHHTSQMQLVPVPDAEDATSSSSSFYVQQRASMAERSGALVVHLPAPSPPPSQPLRSDAVSPWSARPPSFLSDQEGEEMKGGAAGHDLRAATLPDSSTHRHGTASFMHVDRSLLTQQPPLSSGHFGPAAPGPITCLWVDVDRVELPADLPPPVPRLSCYFQVPALHSETWLAAPPTARYTWVYTAETRSGAAGAFGSALPVQSVTQLTAVVREPLVLFFLDADAMAPAATAAAEPCVWAMAVCEWTRAVQHPNEAHAFTLPLLRRDKSVVAGAVVRLSLRATTAITGHNASPTPWASASSPAAATQTGYVRDTYGGLDASTSPLLSPPPALRPSHALLSPGPQSAAGMPETSMEEELLRLEYNAHVSGHGARGGEGLERDTRL